MSYLINDSLKKEEALQDFLNVINEFQTILIGSPFDEPFCYNHKMDEFDVNKLLSIIEIYFEQQKNTPEYLNNKKESERLDMFMQCLISLIKSY